MGELVTGGKGAVGCGKLFKLDRGRRSGLVAQDGEAQVWAGSCGIERGKLPTLFSPKAGQDL